MTGQTAVNLATHIEKYIKDEKLKTKILGTTVENMELAEDRGKCGKIMEEAGINMPEWAAAENSEEVVTYAEKIGYPVLVRPSFVLGGRGMEIVHNKTQLLKYLRLETHAPPAFAATTILTKPIEINLVLLPPTAITTAPIMSAVVKLSAIGEIKNAKKPVNQNSCRKLKPLEISQTLSFSKT